MQRVISRGQFRLSLFWVLLTLILSSGCGVVTWRNVYHSNQLHGEAELLVQEMCGLSDCAIRVMVKKGWTSQQIAYARGCILGFAQAAWTGPVVGVFVDGETCQRIKVAYDVDQRRAVPFAAVEAAVRSEIIKDYGVRPSELKDLGGDVFTWASYQGDGQLRRSTEEFSKRYGH